MVLYSYPQSGPIAEHGAGARSGNFGGGLLGGRVELLPSRTCCPKEKSCDEKYQQTTRRGAQESAAKGGALLELSKHSRGTRFRDGGLPPFHGDPSVLPAVSTGHRRQSRRCRVRMRGRRELGSTQPGTRRAAPTFAFSCDGFAHGRFFADPHIPHCAGTTDKRHQLTAPRFSNN